MSQFGVSTGPQLPALGCATDLRDGAQKLYFYAFSHIGEIGVRLGCV